VIGADVARVVLGAIRLANGTAALLTPGRLALRLGSDPAENPALLYALRMFGARTIVIGCELFARDEQVRAQAVRVAPLIHASDTAAAVLAAASGRVPRRAGSLITCISAANTALALLARREGSD
jgi:hypothetical protein